LNKAARSGRNLARSAALSCDVAFNFGATWKLRKHLTVFFAARRDIVDDTTAMGYIGLQFLTE
jgi:hypothetical protein